MGIFDRMGRVISSNVNALLDKAEDPKKSVALTVDEMQDALRAAKAEIVEALGTQKRFAKKVEELDQEAAKWEGRAELALVSRDEGLARDALKQKKRVIEERDRAEAHSAEQRGVVLTMKREMERMDTKLADLKARQGAIANELSRAKRAASDPLASSGPGGKAFEKFREMEDKVDQSRASADAMSEVDAVLSNGLTEAQLDAKFAALEGRGFTADGAAPAAEPIDGEIARLKKKLRIEG